MASRLNPKAAEFVPGSYQSTDSNWGAMMEAEELGEEHLTEQELEELEACEEWVALQASMEELEQDHLVAIALRYAPESKVNEIRKRCGIKPSKMRSQHKGIRAQGVTRAW